MNRNVVSALVVLLAAMTVVGAAGVVATGGGLTQTIGSQSVQQNTCDEGELLVKFEWKGNSFEPEGGDPMGVVVTNVTTDEDDEPTGFDWSSGTEILAVQVKGGQNTETFPGGFSGSVDFGTKPAISNVVFCVQEETPTPTETPTDTPTPTATPTDTPTPTETPTDEQTPTPTPTPAEPSVIYYQVDFVVGEPLQQVGPEDGTFYNDQHRLIRFLHGSTEDPVTMTGSAEHNLPAEDRECIESQPIQVHDNGTATVEFTVAEGCELTLTLASYEKPGSGFSRSMTQTLVDAETRMLGPGNHTLTVDLPS